MCFCLDTKSRRISPTFLFTREKFVLKDGSMYPILYRMIDKGLITDEQVLVGKRRTRVYYHITAEGERYLDEIKAEYLYITEGISRILAYREDVSCQSADENEINT